MEPADIVQVVSYGLTHDADQALGDLRHAAAGIDDDGIRAADLFLQVLSCRFDDALDAAHALASRDGPPSALISAATDIAGAVCAAEVASRRHHDIAAGDPYAGLIDLLDVEAAMSSGLISTADAIAERIIRTSAPSTAFSVWGTIALIRARGFEGRFDEADVLLTELLTLPELPRWPQLLLLVRGTKIFVDGHQGRWDEVDRGVAAFRRSYPHAVEHDYLYAGAHALAAFGVNAVGRRADAAELILRGGGGPHLPHLQVVDRVYGYEILVEEALARDDVEAALDWSEHIEGLPVAGHHMAGAARGRVKARLAVALRDTAGGIRESADSGVLAALVGADLEVIRARVIEASARAASDDRIRGIEQLEEAARRAGRLGAASVKGWAERELRVHGRRLRNVPGIGWDGLTSTQQGIARLAAVGLRNREIAAALWVSEKTVESHVAAILGALGTTNRVGIGRELSGDDVDPVFGAGLTARQREVALLVARGHSNQEISAELAISEKTVEKHVAGVFDRLGVRTRSAVAAQVRGGRIGSTTSP